MIFVYRAAIAAVATFVSALAGFGAHWVLPAAYVVESKGMIGSVVGLVASLLSLVLSLLIWTSHGLCTAQQSQMQTIASSIIRLDFLLKAYGPEREPGRGLLRVQAQPVEMKFLDPIFSVLDEEVASRAGVRSVELDRVAPRGSVPLSEEIRRIERKEVSLGSEVAVNDVEQNRWAASTKALKSSGRP